MGKVIFWIVIVFVVLLGLRLANVAAAKRRARESGTAKKAAPGDTMVRCANCGVYLPRADALPAAGGYLCGDPGCATRR